MNKVFLDATVLPALLVAGQVSDRGAARRSEDSVDLLLFLMDIRQRAVTSVLTPPVLHRIGRQAGISDETLRKAVAQYDILPVTQEDYAWAAGHEAGGDMQGALQVAVAWRGGCDAFATTDVARAVAYKKYIKTVRLVA